MIDMAGSSNPSVLIAKDKRLPDTIAGDVGKVLTVTEQGYAHTIPTGGRITGEIIMWPTNIPPVGYLRCDNTEYFASEYPALALILPVSSPGKFRAPLIKFPKNSLGVNTLAQEAEAVGTHGHEAEAVPNHGHSATSQAVGNHGHAPAAAAAPGHGHAATAAAAGEHAHSVSGYVTQVVLLAQVGAGIPFVGTPHGDPSSTGSGGAHGHGVDVQAGGAHGHAISESYSGAHGHVITNEASGGHTPVVKNHTGTNQPACTLINFCIKT